MNYQKQVSYECCVKSTTLLDFSILNFKFMIHEIRGYLPNVQWPTAKKFFFQEHDSDNFWENIARIANAILCHSFTFCSTFIKVLIVQICQHHQMLYVMYSCGDQNTHDQQDLPFSLCWTVNAQSMNHQFMINEINEA